MATSRGRVDLAVLVRAGCWTRNIGKNLFGCDAHGKTLDDLGFGMPVPYHSWRPVDLVQGAPELAGKTKHMQLDELLQRADIEAAVLLLSDSIWSLMDAHEFGLTKPGAIFINCERGATVKARGLLDSLNDETLRTHLRVMALPHIGAATFETRHAMGVLTTTNLPQALASMRRCTGACATKPAD